MSYSVLSKMMWDLHMYTSSLSEQSAKQTTLENCVLRTLQDLNSISMVTLHLLMCVQCNCGIEVVNKFVLLLCVQECCNISEEGKTYNAV